MSPTPTGQPDVPEGYGVGPDGQLLDWSTVEARLVDSLHYWMSTVRSDGRPHVVPRWGVWLDEQFWYDGSPETRHAINLRSNPACALHLESGSEVTILEGVSLPSDPVSGELAERLSAGYIRKYAEHGYSPGPASWSDEIAGGLRIFTPRTAVVWSSFPTDLTRFSFD